MCCGSVNLTQGDSKAKTKQGKCRLCCGYDGDPSIKKVTLCPLCNEWFCDSCEKRWLIRGWEAAKQVLRFNHDCN